jgi:diaminopimelate decarboxylase
VITGRTPPPHDAAVSNEAPRRGRPPGRNEVLRGERLAGLAPDELAARFGTPLYVYDLDVVERQAAALRRVLPAAVEVAYAVKANPALAVVAFLAGLGLGADVASGGELAVALKAGIPAERVVVTGPGKRDDELAATVDAGVRAVTVESPRELARLERVAAGRRRRVPVLLRASVSEASRLERVRLVGDDGAGKFGMDPPDLRAAARAAAASPHLDLLGVHRFGASNVLDAAALAAHVAGTVELGREVAAAAGVRLRLVDAGGGLGIPYDAGAESLDLVGLGRHLGRLADAWAEAPDTRGMHLLLEPGRFLVGPAGAYLARVVDRKRVGESEVAILDGGVHHLLRPALVGQEHRVRVLGARGRGPRAWPVTIAGPLCSGLDVFAANAALPLAEPGDLVAVLDVGAYGFTESMGLFLSHPMPAEVAVWNSRAVLIRPRIEPEAWLVGQVIPDWTPGATAERGEQPLRQRRPIGGD